MSVLNKTKERPDAYIRIQEIVFLLACFLYLLLCVQPALIPESQPPVFFATGSFFEAHLAIPGGLIDWLSAFVMQFWFSDAAGTFLLIVFLWLTAFLTKKWIQILTKNRAVHTFHLIPAFILLILHSNYDFRPAVSLALIVNLFGVVLLSRRSWRHPVVRNVAPPAVSLLLFWMTGGAFLIFVVCLGLKKILLDRRYAGGIGLIIVSASLPAIASRYMVPIAMRLAYLHNLSFEDTLKSGSAGFSLILFYIVVPVVIALSRTGTMGRKFGRLAQTTRFADAGYAVRLFAGSILLLAGIGTVASEWKTDAARLIFQINRASREQKWDDLLAFTRQCTNTTPLISSQTALSLYHKGILLDSMFSYPQGEGTVGLLMNQRWCTACPDEASRLYWELGLVNESLHWSHESLELKGATPEILRMLGMVYMVKGDREAASRFFRNLRNVPFRSGEAEECLRVNADSAILARDPAFVRVLSSMPVEDAVSLGRASFQSLEILMKRNPWNKMAFEYLIAFHLLNGDLNSVTALLGEFRRRGYTGIPIHVQEAVIFYVSINPNLDPDRMKQWISQPVIDRFLSYQQKYFRYRANWEETKRNLRPGFGSTYWYYLMFAKPASKQAEEINEYE